MVLLIAYQFVLLASTVKSFLLMRKYGMQHQNYFFIFLFATLLVELIIHVGKYAFEITNYEYVYKIYSVFFILFWGFFFGRILAKKLKTLIIFLTVLTLMLLIFYCDFLSNVLNERMGLLISFFCISICLLWFYQKITVPNNDKISDDPYFWIATGLLFWSSFFLIRVLPRFYFNENEKAFNEIIRNLFSVVNIITYLLYFIGLMKFQKTEKDGLRAN